MDAANDEYVGWVDADDMRSDQYAQYGLVYADYYEIDDQSIVTNVSLRSQFPYSKDSLQRHFMSFHFRLFRFDTKSNTETAPSQFGNDGMAFRNLYGVKMDRNVCHRETGNCEQHQDGDEVCHFSTTLVPRSGRLVQPTSAL